MMNYSRPANIIKQQAVLSAPISFSDLAGHAIATLNFTLPGPAVVLINLYALFRIGTAGQTVQFSCVLDGGSNSIPGSTAGGSGNPDVISAGILQQTFNFTYMLSLSAGAHSLAFSIANQSGATAIQVFAGEVDILY